MKVKISSSFPPRPRFFGEQGWRSDEITRLPPMWPGFDSRTQCQMWVQFAVGSRPCSARFFSGYSGFPFSSKTNISKFQFDLDYCQALYRKPLAQKIVQALPVLLTSNFNSFIYLIFLAARGFASRARYRNYRKLLAVYNSMHYEIRSNEEGLFL